MTTKANGNSPKTKAEPQSLFFKARTAAEINIEMSAAAQTIAPIISCSFTVLSAV